MGSFKSTMAENDSFTSGSDIGSETEEDTPEYRSIFQTLVTRYLGGHVHVASPSTVLNCFQLRMPKADRKPDTTILNESAYTILTKHSSGLSLVNARKINETNNVSSMLLNRERGVYRTTNFSHSRKCKITNRFLPNHVSIIHSKDDKVFCGIFSKDGKTFMSAAQDNYIRFYNSGDGSYNLINEFKARDVGWSIIDVAFHPNQKHFVYSTWSSAVYLCSTADETDLQVCLLNPGRRFCVFSTVFSSDGKEILGGGNDGCLYIYNLERRDCTSKVSVHEYDVNRVVFADDSSQIIYSGGDDGLVKVWDRRTMSESTPKPVGVLAGHIDGVTFIDPKGDGRHLISNSKDQTIKLWDVRVFSTDQAAKSSLKAVDEQNWDYRWQDIPQNLFTNKNKLEGDTSIMTYRGHSVIKTLVRCRFSPLETTGQRYIYTGCGTGSVVIYDSLTGKIKKNIYAHHACVRDVSWHPSRNEILSSSWDCQIGKLTYLSTEKKSGSDLMFQEKKTEPVRRSERLAWKKRKQS